MEMNGNHITNTNKDHMDTKLIFNKKITYLNSLVQDSTLYYSMILWKW